MKHRHDLPTDSAKFTLTTAALLASYSLKIEPVIEADAQWAARRWRPGEGLSLGDRLCLALAHRLDVDAVTADKTWGNKPGIRQLR